jgi:hypothetical protein
MTSTEKMETAIGLLRELLQEVRSMERSQLPLPKCYRQSLIKNRMSDFFLARNNAPAHPNAIAEVLRCTESYIRSKLSVLSEFERVDKNQWRLTSEAYSRFKAVTVSVAEETPCLLY